MSKKKPEKIVAAAKNVVARASSPGSRAGLEPTSMGVPPLFNRTGMEASPLGAKELGEATKLVPPTAGDPHELLEVRREYELEAGPIGTMPPITTPRGAVSAAKEAVKGKKATFLIDKLGERLAFERSGVRAYEGILFKFDVRGGFDGGPTREDLEQFLDEELAHFQMLSEAMRRLGADPTAMTPSADVSAVLSMGVPKVITDPRTTFVQCLDALLVAELVDNDSWTALVQTCEDMNEDALAEEMRSALLEENEHLDAVRSWLQAAGSLAASREEVEAPVEHRARE